jgi:Redoxin.
MKTTQLTLIVLFILVSMAIMQAQHRIVEQPPGMHSNTNTVEIHRVTLTDTATVLDIDAFFRPGWWIRIVSDSYLLADGKKYMIRSGEGIDLDSLFWMPASGEASFRLVFDPLPANTEIFDFMESDCADCFKIWGVDLVNEHIPLPEIPEEYWQSHQPERDMAVRWEKGKAVVSGKFLGYAPRFEMKARLVYFNPVTAKEDMVAVTPDDDGTFHSEIGIYSPAHIYLTYDSPQSDRFWLIAAPGEETNILINLPEANRTRSRLHKQSPGYGKKVMFAGYQSKLNDELNNGALIRNIYTEDFMTAILGMSPREYHDYILEKYHGAVAGNNAQNVSPLAKKIMNMQLAFEANNYLMSADSYLIQAYMEKNRISWEEAATATGSLERHDGYNDYLVQIPYPYNDPDVLLVQSLPHYMNMLGYLNDYQEDELGIYRYMIGSDKVKPEDREILSDYVKRRQEEEIMPDSMVISVLTTYKDLQGNYFEENRGRNFLSRVWNTDDCFLFDLMAANTISRKMEDYYPMTDEQQSEIAGFDPVVKELLLEENRNLLAKIEENKKKTGYTVLDVPDVTNEDLFAEMIRPFKGKAVLVDVWETWCGPCRAANKAMEPLKAQLTDKGMVYLYLASESSPENTWRNMIADLHGYHYRVNEMQSAFLRSLLKSEGVPTYIVLDKEGNQTFHSVGFPGADTMKRELMKALEK